jgi:membrane protein YqaA with SNARE-associated domain
VRIGEPTTDLSTARSAVEALAAAPAGAARDSRLRRHVAALAGSRVGLALVAAWSLAEAISWPLLPEFLLAILIVALPKAGPRLAVTAALGSLLGGALMVTLAGHGVTAPAPLTTPRMHAAATAQLAAEGPAAVRRQPVSGVPYKVYASAAGRQHVDLAPFLAHSALARGTRILGVGLIAMIFGAICRPWRRWYPAYVVWFVLVFTAGLTAIVYSWS